MYIQAHMSMVGNYFLDSLPSFLVLLLNVQFLFFRIFIQPVFYNLKREYQFDIDFPSFYAISNQKHLGFIIQRIFTLIASEFFFKFICLSVFSSFNDKAFQPKVFTFGIYLNIS